MQVDSIYFRLIPVYLVPLKEPTQRKYRICLQRYIRMFGKSQLSTFDQNIQSFPFDTQQSKNLFDFQIFSQEKHQFSYQFVLYGINNINRENRLEIVQFDIETEYLKFSQENVGSFVRKTIFPQSSMQLHWTILIMNLNDRIAQVTASLLPLSINSIRSSLNLLPDLEEKPKMEKVINDSNTQQIQKIEQVKIQVQPNQEQNLEHHEQILQVKTSTTPNNLFLKQEVKSQNTHEIIDSSAGESRQPQRQKEQQEAKLKEQKPIETEGIVKEKKQLQFGKKKLTFKNIFLLILFFLLIGGLAATQIYLTTSNSEPKKSTKSVKQGKPKKAKK